jgi:hypothetical protein
MSVWTPGDSRGDPLSDPSTVADWSRLYLSSAWRSLRGPRFGDVERFCFFIGYARSGHSLTGSLLNAHSEIVISHELDAVRFVDKGFRRSHLFSLILRRDGDFASVGRVWAGYNYAVPDQFQGRFNRLRVIGDKKGGRSALELSEQPELLDRLRRTVRVPIRVIHVTRNPFDNIVTLAARRDGSLTGATKQYARSCRAVAAVRPLLAPDELIELAHESFSENPRAALADLCVFLGVEPEESYLDGCAAAVWPSAKRRRDSVTWSAEERRGVEELIDRYSFLSGYSFDD